MKPVSKLFILTALAAGAGASQAAEYATVVSSTPVMASVATPQRVCSDQQQLVQPQPSGAGALIGAIAGGVLGNSIGGGFGRAAATGLGAVTGAAIGDRVEANGTPPAETTVRRCQTVSSYDQRVIGYDVVYEYAGQRYTTRTATDPGAQIAINVQPAGTVAPVAYAAPPTVAYADAPVVYAPRAPLVYVSPYVGFGYGYAYRPYYRWR